MRSRFDGDTDAGIAMLTVVLVMAVLAALGVTALTVTTVNLRNAGRDRLATGALASAEAAVAAAQGYFQTTSPGAVNCSPTCGATNPWGDRTIKQSLSFPGGGTATVWIEVLTPFSPPNYKSGVYVIHAVGKSATGVGVRTIDEEVAVSPLDFPFGVYVDEAINDKGTPAVTSESMFSRSCINSRSKITFVGTDPFYGIPAGAHSAQYITDANQSSCNTLSYEQTRDAKAIHYDPTGVKNYCNPTYPFDQDGLGGDFSADTLDGTNCSSQQTATSSFFDNAILTNVYSFRPKGLTDTQYARLKSIAQAEGHYYTSTSGITWPAATETNPVMWFDLPSNQQVNVGSGDVAAYAWQNEAGGACVQQHPAMTIVVRGGGLALGSGVSLTGAIFVPDGDINIAGGVNLVGTIFANTATITGTANISLNDCYIKNIPGPTLSVDPTRFHEVDR